MRKITMILFVILFVPFNPSVKANEFHQNEKNGIRYLLPIRTEDIEVIRQDISYQISTESDSSFTPLVAHVTSNYILKNTADTNATITLAIPIVETNDDLLKVDFDDIAIEKEIIHIKGLYFKNDTWYSDTVNSLEYNQIVHIIDQAYKNSKNMNPLQSIGLGVRVALFSMELPSGETHELQLAYIENPMLQKNPWSDKMTPKFTYYNKSLEHWKSIKELNVSVETPEQYQVFEYSLPNVKAEGDGKYVGNYSIIPFENFSFLVKEKIKGMQFNFKQYKSKEFFTFVATFAGIISATLLIALIIDHRDW